MYKEITEYLKNNLSEERYAHTVAVVDECMYYADIFKLSEADRNILYRAALFHDITKEKTPEEQIDLCRVYNIEYNEAYLSTPALFHAITGGRYANSLFPSLCNDEVIELIAAHTTGCIGMTLLQKILFIADSTEATRKHESCVSLRRYFHDNVSTSDPYELLDLTIVRSLNNTIAHLIDTGRAIDVKTVETRNSLLKNSEVI